VHKLRPASKIHYPIKLPQRAQRIFSVVSGKQTSGTINKNSPYNTQRYNNDAGFSLLNLSLALCSLWFDGESGERAYLQIIHFLMYSNIKNK
jgi:hypothetical protein